MRDSDRSVLLSNIQFNAKPMFLRGSLQTIHAQSSVTVTSISKERRHHDVIKLYGGYHFPKYEVVPLELAF